MDIFQSARNKEKYASIKVKTSDLADIFSCIFKWKETAISRMSKVHQFGKYYKENAINNIMDEMFFAIIEDITYLIDKGSNNQSNRKVDSKFNQAIQTAIKKYNDIINVKNESERNVTPERVKSAMGIINRDNPIIKRHKKSRKLHKCNQCQKKFFTLLTLKNHINAVHHGTKYYCLWDDCSYVSGYLNNCRYHVRKIHFPDININTQECLKYIFEFTLSKAKQKSATPPYSLELASSNEPTSSTSSSSTPTYT